MILLILQYNVAWIYCLWSSELSEGFRWHRMAIFRNAVLQCSVLCKVFAHVSYWNFTLSHIIFGLSSILNLNWSAECCHIKNYYTVRYKRPYSNFQAGQICLLDVDVCCYNRSDAHGSFVWTPRNVAMSRTKVRQMCRGDQCVQSRTRRQINISTEH